MKLLLTLAALVLAAPHAAANHPGPPADHTCVFGYNPSAYSNVCYDLPNGPATEWVVLNGATACVYAVGNFPGCQAYFVPGYTGGTPHAFVQLTAWCHSTGGVYCTAVIV